MTISCVNTCKEYASELFIFTLILNWAELSHELYLKHQHSDSQIIFVVNEFLFLLCFLLFLELVRKLVYLSLHLPAKSEFPRLHGLLVEAQADLQRSRIFPFQFGD